MLLPLTSMAHNSHILICLMTIHPNAYFETGLKIFISAVSILLSVTRLAYGSQQEGMRK
jgi:hypothetical protein